MKNIPEIGQLVRLDVTLRSSGLWLGPVWAIICGIVASGGFRWTGPAILHAALVFFLVDVAWATLWAAAAETDWATPAKHWGSSEVDVPYTLPYAQPDAPGDRAVRWLAHTSRWWRDHLQPAIGSAVSTILLCVLLGATLSAVLGWQAMALSVAGLAVVQLGVVVGRGSGCPVPALKATLEIGLAWLVAHIMFAPLTLPSALLAGAFAATYAAGLGLIRGSRRIAIWNWAQFAVALLLLVMRQPVAALVVFMLVLPQLLLEPVLQRDHRSPSGESSGAWYVRSTQVWLMAAMLIAAISVS